jgi:sulfonate transport system substrate-binding protein
LKPQLFTRPGRRLPASVVSLLTALLFLLGTGAAQAEEKPSIIRIANPGVGIGGRPVVAYGAWSLLHIKGQLEDEFRKDGIKVRWTFARGAGPAVNEQFANDLADISLLGDLPSIIARSSGVKTKVLAAAGLTNLYIAVPADSSIQNFKDLVGKKLAVFKGTCLHLSANRILAAQGLSEKDLRTINMDLVSTLAALTTKDVDAAIGGNELLALKERGAVRLIYSTKGDPRYTCNSTVVAAEPFLNKYPSIVKRILRTYVRSAKWVSEQESNPTDVFNLFTKSGIPFASFKSDWVGDSFKSKVSPRIDDYLRARYRASLKDALKFGLIRKEFDVDSWFDPSLLEQVLKEENLVGYWPDRPLK